MIAVRTLRTITALVVPSVRLVPWAPLSAGAAAGAVLLAPLVVLDAEPDSVLTGLRVAAVALASGAAFILDDETEDDLAATPTTIMTRRVLGLALALPAAALCWWGLVVLARASRWLPEEVPLPVGGLTVEAVALLVAGLATAVAARTWTRSGALVTPAVLGGLLLTAHLLPPRWALIADPAVAAQWRDAHVRWAWLGGLALAGLLWGVRDRGRRGPLRLVRPLTPRARQGAPRPIAAIAQRPKERV